LPEVTEENYEKPVKKADIPAKTWSAYLLNTSQEHYHYVNLFRNLYMYQMYLNELHPA
jgi:hypothetical protein